MKLITKISLLIASVVIFISAFGVGLYIGESKVRSEYLEHKDVKSSLLVGNGRITVASGESDGSKILKNIVIPVVLTTR